jgi:hypothetical protein
MLTVGFGRRSGRCGGGRCLRCAANSADAAAGSKLVLARRHFKRVIIPGRVSEIQYFTAKLAP